MALRFAPTRVRPGPAAVYLAVRLVGVGVLAVMAGGNPVPELRAWDGDWLLSIAQYGYGGVPADHLDAFGHHTAHTTLGFFPGYPTLVGVLAPLLGLTAAGLVVSLVAGVIAAYGLDRLGTLVPGGSPRAGLLLVALFAAAPMGIVLSMTYTEALFCALAAWALVHVLERHWIAAGLCTAGAGLVRPAATALVAAVVLAAVAAIVERARAAPAKGEIERDAAPWRPWVGGALAASGLVGYLGYVAVLTGQPDGWSRIQREGWGWYVDGGGATLRFLRAALSNGTEVFELAIVMALLASLALLGVAVRTRLPWPLIVYSAVLLLSIWGTSGLDYAKLRLLVPAFPLLVPIAIGLAARRTGTAVAVVTGLALASAWYGGYALTIWRYGI